MAKHTEVDSRARIDRIEAGLCPLDSAGEGSEALAATVRLAERMIELKVPGVGLSVVENIELSWSRSYGLEEAGTAQTVTDKTLFEIGSTTKLVTAIATLQMVERGAIALDDDINDALVGWKVPRSEYSAEETVTLRRLLNHTSGIPGTSFSWDEGTTPTLQQVLRGEAPAVNERAVLVSTPGSEHVYSNLGYVVIQQVLEDLSGQPFDVLIQNSILDPIGMDDSTFDPASSRLRMCRPHDGEGAPHPLHMHPSAKAQGGLLSTPEDLARLAIDLMNSAEGRGGCLLQEQTMQMMLQPDPELDINAFGFTDGQGLGLFLLGRGPEMKFLAPGMNLPGSTGLVIAWPSRGFAVSLTTNGLNGQLLQVEVLNSIGVEYGFEWGLQIG